MRNAAAASPMPSIASFQLWVKPKSFGLDQTLLKSSSFELGFSSSGSLHLVVDVTRDGLKEGILTVLVIVKIFARNPF